MPLALLAVCGPVQAQGDNPATDAPAAVMVVDSAALTMEEPTESGTVTAARSTTADADGMATLSSTLVMPGGKLGSTAKSANNSPAIISYPAAVASEAPHRQVPGKDAQAVPGLIDIQPIATDDSRATAIAVPVGTSVSGSISPARDVDWYSFTLVSPSVVTIQTTGSTNTYGVLYNSAGAWLEDRIYGGAGTNFRIDRFLGAGTYYIRVEGNNFIFTITGEYRLSVAVAEVSATAVPVGTSVSGSITPADDVDWYSFTLVSPSFITIETTGTTDTEGDLYSSAGRILEYDRNDGAGNNFRIEKFLEAGTYYIRVKGLDDTITGNYTLIVTDATAVTLGTSVSGSISAAGERDYYSFTLASPSAITIETTGTTDTEGRLYNSARAVLESDSDGGTGLNFWIARYLDAGTYYIRVDGETDAVTGHYRLSVTDATAVTVGTSVSGFISPAGGVDKPGVAKSIEGILQRAVDVDWYSFTLASPSLVTIQTKGATDTVGELYNSAGTRLRTNSDDGTGNNFRIERDLGAGTYYIRVAGQTDAITGGYSLSVVTTTQAAASGVPTVTATSGTAYNEDVEQIQRILDLPVTTSGTAYNEDVELTAAIGSVADVNGIDSSSLQWQWYSAPAPTSGTPADNDYTAITDATAATFTPLQANVGQYIRACLSFTDGIGTTEGPLCSTAAIIVNVNDAPTSADNTISMFTSDASYTFKAADFPFMDQDSEHTELAGITITSTAIPSGASFTNAGNAVTDDTTVMRADIGDLVFTPASGATAMDNYASFTFTVSDGNASSDPANTITINLVPPQTPATGMPAITGTAVQGQTLNAALGTVADVNGINQSTIAWQWQQTDSTDWADIAGASAMGTATITFTPLQEHVGQYVRACITFMDMHSTPADEGPLCSAVAGPIANAPAVTVGTTESGSISERGRLIGTVLRCLRARRSLLKPQALEV